MLNHTPPTPPQNFSGESDNKPTIAYYSFNATRDALYATHENSRQFNDDERNACLAITSNLLRCTLHDVRDQFRTLLEKGFYGRGAAKCEFAYYIVNGDRELALKVCDILCANPLSQAENLALKGLRAICLNPEANLGAVIASHFPNGIQSSLNLWAASHLLSSRHYRLAELNLLSALGNVKDSKPVAAMLLQVRSLEWDCTYASKPIGTVLEPDSSCDADALVRQSEVTFRRRTPTSEADLQYALAEVSRRLQHYSPDGVKLFVNFVGAVSRNIKFKEQFKYVFSRSRQDFPRQKYKKLDTLVVQNPVDAKQAPPILKLSASKATTPMHECTIKKTVTVEKVQKLLKSENGSQTLISLLKQQPRNASANWGMSVVYMRRNELDRAAENIFTALKLDPKLLPALVDGARLAVARKKLEVADHLLQEYQLITHDSFTIGPLLSVIEFAKRKSPITADIKSEVAVELEYVAEVFSPLFAFKLWEAIDGRIEANIPLLKTMRTICRNGDLVFKGMEITFLIKAMLVRNESTSGAIIGSREDWNKLRREVLSGFLKCKTQNKAFLYEKALRYAIELSLSGDNSPSLWNTIDLLETRLGIKRQ